MSGDVKFAASQELPEIADAWSRSLSAGSPVVIEAVTDRDVPTLPPHITMDQAKTLTQTLLKGDPDEGGIIKQAVKGMVARLMSQGG